MNESIVEVHSHNNHYLIGQAVNRVVINCDKNQDNHLTLDCSQFIYCNNVLSIHIQDCNIHTLTIILSRHTKIILSNGNVENLIVDGKLIYVTSVKGGGSIGMLSTVEGHLTTNDAPFLLKVKGNTSLIHGYSKLLGVHLGKYQDKIHLSLNKDESDFEKEYTKRFLQQFLTHNI